MIGYQSTPGFPIELLREAVETLAVAWRAEGEDPGELVLCPRPDGTIMVTTRLSGLAYGSYPPLAVLRARRDQIDADRIAIETTRIPFSTTFTRTRVMDPIRIWGADPAGGGDK